MLLSIILYLTIYQNQAHVIILKKKNIKIY